jgi:cytochrome c oxidase assembly protein subunit 15
VADTAKFRIASRLALTTVILMFGLIILGSIVRTTGSGLACPDWPLCQGRLIPPFQFNVLIEWFHRLVALLVSVMLFVTVAWVLANGPLRARLGGLAALAIVLLLAQILLGALTVWKLLDPGVVGGHLGVALLLFSTMLTLSLAAAQQAEAGPLELRPRPAGLLPLFALTTLVAYAQCVLGGVVAASHAGLACSDWPTCNGEWFPPLQGLVGLQMAHRWLAYGLTVLLVVVAIRGRLADDPVVARAGTLMLGLTVGQIALGVMNIALGLRVWLSALHLANAAGILALALASTIRIAMLTTRRVPLGAVAAS